MTELTLGALSDQLAGARQARPAQNPASPWARPPHGVSRKAVPLLRRRHERLQRTERLPRPQRRSPYSEVARRQQQPRQHCVPVTTYAGNTDKSDLPASSRIGVMTIEDPYSEAARIAGAGGRWPGGP